MTDQFKKLDNPVWWSLTTCHRRIAQSKGSAHMMGEEFGPFAALPGGDAEQIEDFLALVENRNSPALTFTRGTPFGAQFAPSGKGVQFVADQVTAPSNTPGIEVLTEADAFQIYDLAKRARPGPFECRTHQLGDFIGIKRDGRLIAMAGQRLKLPGFTEISAVSVDSAYRGQGLGKALVLEMAARIMAEGDAPFLHSYADNAGAIALYQRLGFRIRAEVSLTIWDAEKVAETRLHATTSDKARRRLAV
ncbi:MAG: GNAT family N-acetyltransferase [Pseudomonadota bacterium]